MWQEPGIVQEPGCGWEQDYRSIGGDSSIWAWIWQGTRTRESSRYWEGGGAWEVAGGCKSLGMGGYFNRGIGLSRSLGWDRSLGGEMTWEGCKSLREDKSLGAGRDSSTEACAGHEYGAGTKGG